MKTKLTKRNLNKNTNGLAPIFYLLVVGLVAVGGISAYAYFTAPDVTYNVAEGGFFNIAGIEISSFEIVAIAMGILIFVAYVIKTQSKNRP